MIFRRLGLWAALVASIGWLAGCGEGVAGSQREPRSPSSPRDSTELSAVGTGASRAGDEAAGPVRPLLRDVALDGSMAYLLVPDALVVASLEDPDEPVVAGRLVLPQTPLRLTVAAGQAWIACDQGGLQIVSLAQPRTPQVTGGWAPEAGGVTRVATDGKLAAVAVPGRGVSILDVSDPAAPVERKAIAIDRPVVDLVLHDEMVYALADRVYLIDVTQPAEAAIAGEYAVRPARLAAAATVSGQTLLLTNQGLRLLNFSVPARPRSLGALSFAELNQALTPATPAARAASESETAPADDEPVAASDEAEPAPPPAADEPEAMPTATDAPLSSSATLAAQHATLAPAGEAAATEAGEPAATDDEETPTAESAPAPPPDPRLVVAGGLILLVDQGTVTLLEVEDRKSIVAQGRLADVTEPVAAALRGDDRLAIGQRDGQLRLWTRVEAAWQPQGSLLLTDQVATESLPAGLEPLPLTEGARRAMEATPQPSDERPAGAPDPA